MKLEDYRKNIDIIDTQIMVLLDERLEIVKEIGKFKSEHNIPVLDNSREKIIYEKINKLELTNKQEIADIYREIMKITKGMQ